MSHSEMCRICTSYTDALSSTNLFERNHKTLVTQIKDITGQLLRNERDLPKSICSVCEQNLRTAHNFRKRCLDSQAYFNSAKYKTHLQRKSLENIPYIDAGKRIEAEDEGDEEEIIVIIKEEANATDSNENDILEIYTKQNKKILNKALKSESKYLPDPTLVTHNENELDSVAEAVNNDKEHKKPKKNLSNKLVQRKVPSLKGKKSDEKVDLICDQCGNHFNCRHHFLTHLRRHTNDKPFKCEVCPDKFYTHSELKRHMRRHTGEKPFACKHCQRRFTDYSTRIKHERTHTNERPYSCSQCGKAFTTSYVLKNHMLVHTGERSFKCSLCNKAFQRQTHLTVHFRSIMHKQMLEKQLQNQEGSLANESEPMDFISNQNLVGTQ